MFVYNFAQVRKKNVNTSMQFCFFNSKFQNRWTFWHEFKHLWIKKHESLIPKVIAIIFPPKVGKLTFEIIEKIALKKVRLYLSKLQIFGTKLFFVMPWLSLIIGKYGFFGCDLVPWQFFHSFFARNPIKNPVILAETL